MAQLQPCTLTVDALTKVVKEPVKGGTDALVGFGMSAKVRDENSALAEKHERTFSEVLSRGVRIGLKHWGDAEDLPKSRINLSRRSTTGALGRLKTGHYDAKRANGKGEKSSLPVPVLALPRFNKNRMLAGRGEGPHPYQLGADWVQRYFQVMQGCARAAQLRLEQQLVETAKR